MKEQDIKLAIEQECDAVGIPITSVKHYRKSIFSDKIKNLNIAVIKTNKLESFIYLQLTFENYAEVEIIKIN
jgi:hypothetical protein